MNDEINRIAGQSLQSLLYTIDYAHFDSFGEMEKYLELAEDVLSQKIDKVDEKMEMVQDQYIRVSSVFELNNKKRLKEEELLQLERERIRKQLQEHKQRINIEIHPMTLILKQKKAQLQKLEQTKDIIEDFNKLVKGKQEDIKKLMPLDEKNFKNSALRIYVFQALLQGIDSPEYDEARVQINNKYKQLKHKILFNFKEGFWKKDSKAMRNVLPYCQQYELMEDISEFYNEQAFKEVLKITKLNREDEGEVQIKNMFFLIERGFKYAFIQKDINTGEINPYEIFLVMGQFEELIGRKLITYVFEKIIRESIESVLRSLSSSVHYLKYLQVFYDESKKLLKQTQNIIADERLIHLMSTYFESIFDTYLDSYLSKQLNSLSEIYEDCSSQMIREIMEASESIAKRQNQISSQKNTLRKLMEFNIQSKKKIKVTNEQLRAKAESLTKIFMNPSLELIFEKTKKSLIRNNKIAKINEMDRNRTQILHIFVDNLQQIIQNLINLIAELIPPFEEGAPLLDQEFFYIIPNINLLLQRIQLIYEQYKKQTKYSFSEGIKLEQKKQNLLINCSKSLNNVVGEALASILTVENTILRSSPNQYCLLQNKPTPPHESCMKVIQFLQKYVKAISRINLQGYRNNIMKSLGLQFCSLITDYYSTIPYTKDGLSRIFIDIAKYKSVITMFNSNEVENKFKILRSLIDIYVIKNDEKSIMKYVTDQKQAILQGEKDQIIQKFITNKLMHEK